MFCSGGSPSVLVDCSGGSLSFSGLQWWESFGFSGLQWWESFSFSGLPPGHSNRGGCGDGSLSVLVHCHPASATEAEAVVEVFQF